MPHYMRANVELASRLNSVTIIAENTPYVFDSSKFGGFVENLDGAVRNDTNASPRRNVSFVNMGSLKLGANEFAKHYVSTLE